MTSLFVKQFIFWTPQSCGRHPEDSSLQLNFSGSSAREEVQEEKFNNQTFPATLNTASSNKHNRPICYVHKIYSALMKEKKVFVVVLFIVVPDLLCEEEGEVYISSIHRLFLFHNFRTTIIINSLIYSMCVKTLEATFCCSIQTPS